MLIKLPADTFVYNMLIPFIINSAPNFNDALQSTLHLRATNQYFKTLAEIPKNKTVITKALISKLGKLNNITNTQEAQQMLIDISNDELFLTENKKNWRYMNHLATNFLIEKGAQLNTVTVPNKKNTVAILGNSALIRAVENHNHPYFIEALLKLGANPNQKNELGSTPLMLAKARDRHDMYILLLNYKADPHVKDVYGLTVDSDYYTPKGYICDLDGDIAMIPSRPDIDIIIDKLNTIITSQQAQEILWDMATSSNLVNEKIENQIEFPLEDPENLINKIVNFLIDKGAEINKGTTVYNSPLSVALEHHDHPYFIGPLLARGANPNQRNEYGSTLLMLTKAKNKLGFYNILLSYGADTNAKDEYGFTVSSPYYTPEHYSNLARLNIITTPQNAQEELWNMAISKDLVLPDIGGDLNSLNIDRIVNFLIKKGAEINKGTTIYNSPLSIAFEHHDHPYFINALLDFKANPNQRNEYGSTPLMLTKAKNKLGFYNILLSYGADINATDEYGFSINNSDYYTPEGYCDVKELDNVVATELNTIITPQDAQTKLWHMAQSNDFVHQQLGISGNFLYANKIVNFLIKKGAEINKGTTIYNSPLSMALNHNHLYFIEALLKHGANPNQRNEYGSTPLMLTKAKNKLGFYNILLSYGADTNAKDEYGFTYEHFYYTPECYCNLETVIATIEDE